MAELERWLPPEVLASQEYQTARTHRSVGTPHNERQEFLGDALLGWVISEHLYDRFPDLSEGDLTRLRSHLVCRSMLSDLAQKMELGELVIVNDRQPLSARARRILEGNALEAMVAAVYQVCGLEATRTFIYQLYEEELKHLPEPDTLSNSKTELQELLAGQGHPNPRYLLKQETPKQSPRFKVHCEVPDLNLQTSGVGERIREAEQDAAAAMLRKIRQP